MADAATTYEEELSSGAEAEKKLLDQQIAEEKAATQAGLQKLQQARAERVPEWEQFKKKQAETELIQPPKLERPPPAPKTQEMLKPTSLQQTMGMASIFALLSVGVAKHSAIYGLKALGGFMEGAHAGNVEQAAAALKDFNAEMSRVHLANESSLQEYNAIFQNKKYTLEMQEHAFKLKALEFNDELALQEYGQKGMIGTHALLRERAKVDMTFAKEMQRYKEWEIKIDLQRQRLEKMGAGTASTAASIFGIPMTDIPQAAPGQKNEAFLSMLPPVQADIVRRIAKGDIATSGFGNMAVKDRNEYIKAATAYDPSFSTRIYGLIDKTMKEFTPGGIVGTNILAINTMTHHIDDFADAYNKLNNSQVQRWNSAKNKMTMEFGDPALQRVQVSGLAAAGELAKVIKGGRAAPTDQEMAEWEKVFSTSMSKEQMNAVVWQALQTAGGRLTSMEDAYKQQVGRPFGALSPDTKQIILKRKPKNVAPPYWLKSGEESKPAGKVTLEQAKEMIKKYGSAAAAMKAAKEQGLEF